jgi:glutaconyl-CoA/methylmalonyl-CoA decarboxylase subunit gamma
MKEYVLTIAEKEYQAEIKELTAEYALISVDGKDYRVELKQFGNRENQPVFKKADPPTAAAAPPPAEKKMKTPAVDSGAVKSPLPGMILEMHVAEGDPVKAGQTLLVLEAMKMENQIQAPHDGTVKKIYFRNGDTVAEGEVLCEIDRPFMTTL